MMMGKLLWDWILRTLFYYDNFDVKKIDMSSYKNLLRNKNQKTTIVETVLGTTKPCAEIGNDIAQDNPYVGIWTLLHFINSNMNF